MEIYSIVWANIKMHSLIIQRLLRLIQTLMLMHIEVDTSHFFGNSLHNSYDINNY